MYEYVLNSPLNFIDELGLCIGGSLEACLKAAFDNWTRKLIINFEKHDQQSENIFWRGVGCMLMGGIPLAKLTKLDKMLPRAYKLATKNQLGQAAQALLRSIFSMVPPLNVAKCYADAESEWAANDALLAARNAAAFSDYKRHVKRCREECCND